MSVYPLIVNRQIVHMQTEPEIIEVCPPCKRPICSRVYRFDKFLCNLTGFMLPPSRAQTIGVGDLYIRKRGGQKEFVRKIKDSHKADSDMNFSEEELQHLEAMITQKRDRLVRERDQLLEQERQQRIGVREPQPYHYRFTRPNHATKPQEASRSQDLNPRHRSWDQRQPPSPGKYAAYPQPNSFDAFDKPNSNRRSRRKSYSRSPFIEPVIFDSSCNCHHLTPSRSYFENICACKNSSRRPSRKEHKSHSRKEHEHYSHRHRRPSYHHVACCGGRYEYGSGSPPLTIQTRHPDDYYY